MLTDKNLEEIEKHWAVSAIPVSVRASTQAMAKRLVARDTFSFVIPTTVESPDFNQIAHLAFAYQVAAAECTETLVNASSGQLSEKALVGQAAAFKAYELLRVLPMPQDTKERFWHVLTMCALGYASDRWSDVRRWCRENDRQIHSPLPVGANWGARIANTLYDCWIRLFRKLNWNDVHDVGKFIVELKELQSQFEEEYLNSDQQAAAPRALELISLYHWARGTELIATFMLQGQPRQVKPLIDQQLESAKQAAVLIGDYKLDVLLRWLHIAGLRMVTNSVWSISYQANPKVTAFIERITQARGLFELLPPQQAAIQKHGLLDPASKAIVVDLPTSAGKTVLAQFRIMQALNFFQDGWVAYVAPTRALVSQIARQLRRDFEPLGLHVEQLSSASTLDEFEERMIAEDSPDRLFHVLVSTPEKLQIVIRNKLIKKPLALLVMDEAHNLEDPERGMRIELLLALAKRECEDANFMLLTPFVPNSQELAAWLEPDSGKAISLSSSAWQPNERIVGMFTKVPEAKGNWHMNFEILHTGPKSFDLEETFRIPGPRPMNVAVSAAGRSIMTAAMAKAFCHRGTSIAIARKIDDCWQIARSLENEIPDDSNLSPEVKLVQGFLQTEISTSFELVGMLRKGIAVHHAGLSDEARTLVEWLAEENKLKVLCATTTIAQGINFPVSSVFLASRFIASASGAEMSERTFWNLAGRAGRIGQGSLGIIGIAAEHDQEDLREFVKRQTGNLQSRFVELLAAISAQGKLQNLDLLIQENDWVDFRTFVSHLVNVSRDKSKVIQEADLVLRNTWGYTELKSSEDSGKREMAAALLNVTRKYAGAVNLNEATLVDSTGFSPEAIKKAMVALRNLEKPLKVEDWNPEQLFGPANKSALASLVGIMVQIPQLRKMTEMIGANEHQSKIANVATDWVGGKSIEDIAKNYFSGDGVPDTKAITAACQGIYRSLANFGTWGISALSKIPNSGIDFKKLSESEIRKINQLPAMLYHGVRTPEAVLMRMNGVPRSISEKLGEGLRQSVSESDMNVRTGREYVLSLSTADWNKAMPSHARITGSDYQFIWRYLSGNNFD